MRYTQLMILVTLAAFALSSTAAVVVLGLAWPRLTSGLARVLPAARARLILLLRLAPTLVGGCLSVVTLIAFLRYEPRSTAERPGFVLLAAAALGAGLLLAGFWRVALRGWRTFRFLQAVQRTAAPLTLPGVGLPAWQLDTLCPLVAIAGVWRPRFLIARRVVEQIPGDELLVIVRHELAHVRQHDNVARLLLTGMPDVLALAERWLGIGRTWSAAAEEAADDLATGDDPEARVCLASALVRVAKMAARQPASLPLLAFHDGDSIERRVGRLLGAAAPGAPAPLASMGYVTIALLAGTVPLLGSNAFLLGLHHAIENLVNAL